MKYEVIFIIKKQSSDKCHEETLIGFWCSSFTILTSVALSLMFIKGGGPGFWSPSQEVEGFAHVPYPLHSSSKIQRSY